LSVSAGAVAAVIAAKTLRGSKAKELLVRTNNPMNMLFMADTSQVDASAVL